MSATYWPKEKRFFFVFGQGGVFARVRRAWGVQWRGGFFGVLLTEKKEP